MIYEARKTMEANVQPSGGVARGASLLVMRYSSVESEKRGHTMGYFFLWATRRHRVVCCGATGSILASLLDV